ncbi:heme exporter protein B [Alteromonas sp. KUL42]|uniref:heme exporter protein CcmB n=1 Tax=Alteromonas sp. KUL42 TaxID=2480797 RepID=UPI001035DF05|nr:heme exporter protein CcmB [Alteromonas sp. KUL42]TAP37489.1 heme exporter protein CcmB [Alteromonas sp. KUL42]GEA05901.1 heme exporter protein B [Alteromonas sp. KUL42]
MSLYQGIFKRDMHIAFKQKAELVQPLMFLLMVVTLFPLGVSPSPDTLQRIGPGVIWIAAILSSLMAMERLFRDDFQDGSLEQYVLSGMALPAVSTVKVVAHWLVSFVPVLLLSPLLAMFLNLTFDMYVALLLTLILGTPLLSLIGAIAVGLTVGLQKGGVLLALLLIPVFIPLLIFATSAVDSAALQLPYYPQLAIIAAMLLLAAALAPFAIAYSLKVSQN